MPRRLGPVRVRRSKCSLLLVFDALSRRAGALQSSIIVELRPGSRTKGPTVKLGGGALSAPFILTVIGITKYGRTEAAVDSVESVGPTYTGLYIYRSMVEGRGGKRSREQS